MSAREVRRYVFITLFLVLAGWGLSEIYVFPGSAESVCREAAASAGRGRSAVYLKSRRALCVFEDGRVLYSARASHGVGLGPKVCAGDQRTPEGSYELAPARSSTRFRFFFPISYPGDTDRTNAARAGCRPGGAIGIHGPQWFYAWLGPYHALVNHSDGCLVTDREALSRLRPLVRTTIPIQIRP